jgi:hypothetical protein
VKVVEAWTLGRGLALGRAVCLTLCPAMPKGPSLPLLASGLGRGYESLMSLNRLASARVCIVPSPRWDFKPNVVSQFDAVTGITVEK